MNYLSAVEMAKIWNISSRMVAYYCESGRIKGAVKKGKLWLIPENAQKPHDKRRVKQKEKLDIPDMQASDINQADRERLNDVYRTSEIMENLGLSREVLRYYEKIGLIQPKRGRYNQYREFDFLDVSHLLAIDFYKKRGFSASGVKELLLQKEISGYMDKMEEEIAKIQDSIADMEKLLCRLQETKSFCQKATEEVGVFSIREIPLYKVKETIDFVTSLDEYKEKVIQYINLESEDILSNMVRVLAFDERGYTGSKICIVKKVEKAEKGVYLENGKCVYAIIEAENNDNSIMGDIFVKAYQWAKKHGVTFCGVAYIFISFIFFEEHTERYFYEIWIPIKK